jgi:hypothetical protein
LTSRTLVSGHLSILFLSPYGYVWFPLSGDSTGHWLIQRLVLRERALFVVRNLLLNNPANQAIISKMDPVGIISDETGEILPLPDKMRKTNPGTGNGYVGGADHDRGNPL